MSRPAVFVLSLLAAVGVLAEEPSTQPPQTFNENVAVGYVMVPFTVLGSKGSPLTDVKRDEITLLVDGDSALLIPAGDPGALADAIRRLVGDAELARRIATGGRAAYERAASETVLGERWRSLIAGLL